MKKIKVMAIILAFGLFIFSGCAMGVDKLRLASTSLPVSSICYNYLNTVTLLKQNSQERAADTNTNLRLENFFSNIFFQKYELIGVISAVDFCEQITVSNNSNLTEKLYIDGGTYILVTRSKQGRTIKVEIYENTLGQYSDFSEIKEQQNSLKANYTFEVKSNGDFAYNLTFIDSDKKNCNAKVSFNLKSGILNMELNTFNKHTSTAVIKTDVEILFYQNNVWGGRQIVDYTAQDGVKHCLVWECISKDFYKRAKIGEVKDTKEYSELKSISEESYATYDDGDLNGYVITYDNLSDNRTDDENYTTLTSYGIFE